MRKLLVLLSLVAAAACGDSATSAASVAGTYNLQTVNGSPLPFLEQPSGPKIELLSEQLVLTSSGTFTITDQERTTPTGGSPSTQTLTFSGTYTLSGNTATFVVTNTPGTTIGTFSGSILTISERGFLAVYQKQ